MISDYAPMFQFYSRQKVYRVRNFFPIICQI